MPVHAGVDEVMARVYTSNRPPSYRGIARWWTNVRAFHAYTERRRPGVALDVLLSFVVPLLGNAPSS